MTTASQVLIGADPELFLCDKATRSLVPALGLVPGVKHDPHIVDGGALQVDGIAAEFNLSPTKNEMDFLRNLDVVMETLRQQVGDKYDFLTDASVEFDDEFRKAQEYESMVLGCSPDWNAWTGAITEPADSDTNMRTAGGHIHLGFRMSNEVYGDIHMTACRRLTKLLDEEIGTYSVLWDTDTKRRSMYGAAGCFRPKTYGLEYRTLSNKWIFNRGIASFVYKAAQRAVDRFNDGDYNVPDYVQEIIDESLKDHVFFDNNQYASLIRRIVSHPKNME